MLHGAGWPKPTLELPRPPPPSQPEFSLRAMACSSSTPRARVDYHVFDRHVCWLWPTLYLLWPALEIWSAWDQGAW